MERLARIIRELRWWADRDAISVCDYAADVIEKAGKLAEALDNYTKEPNSRNWTEVILARKELR